MSSGLPDFPQTIPPDTLLGRTGINAGPVQALPFSTLASIFPPPPAPPAAYVPVNILQFGGVGDGVTDNTIPFLTFAGFALAQTNPVIVYFPPGVYHIGSASGHSDAAGFFQGIPNLTIVAYGAFIDHFSCDFPTIISGPRGTSSWRIQSTNIGDNSFTMLLANTAMAFAAGNMQATNVQSVAPSVGCGFVQSANSYTTGKFYFEATINAIITGSGTQNIGIGISNGFGPFNSSPSSLVGTRSFMVFDDGAICQQFKPTFGGTQLGSLGATFANGNVIGCAIDMTNQLGWFRINNGNWNGSGAANPVTGAGGFALSSFNPAGFSGWQLLPAFVCTFIAANPGSVTHNFGGSGYAFTRPSGFGDWSGTLNTNYPVNIQPGDWVAITSCDAQDVNSNPPNWQFIEYHQVNTVNASTGVCIIAKPFMRYAHSAIQPDNTINRNQFNDHGGPASVFLLSTSSYPGITGGIAGASNLGPNRGQPWAVTTRVYGAILGAGGGQHILAGQNFEFIDCTFNDQVAPTVNQRAVYQRCVFNSGTEIDKDVSQLEFIDCDWNGDEVGLTASVEMATFENCSLHHVSSAFKQTIFRNCMIDSLTIGSTFAQNLTLNVENCIIPNMSFASPGTLALADASFANGTFTLNTDTISQGAMANYWRFTIPGTTAYVAQGNTNLGSPFTITGATNINKGGILTATIAGGAAYTNGQYNYVALTGGAGAQALANITVSGGAVAKVVLINAGLNYVATNVLTTAAANIGGTGAGFTYTVNTVSANNIVQIFTTLAALPTYAGAGPPVADGIGLLQGLSVNFNNCLGNAQVNALSLGQDGLPAFSYTYLEISSNNIPPGGGFVNNGTTRSMGYAVKLRVNVRKPYTGAAGSMALQVFNDSQRFVLSQSGNTWTNGAINPTFDLKVAGERVITANRVSGLQPNDTDHALGGTPQPFGQMWFKDDTFTPFLTASLAADTIDKYPIVDVEIITDQSVGSYSSVGTIDYLQESGWHIVAGTYTAQIGEKIAANTTGGAFTLTLPPSPAIGDFVKAYDAGNTFTANNLTIARNGNNINSAAANFTANTNGQVLELVFISAAIGWRVFT